MARAKQITPTQRTNWLPAIALFFLAAITYLPSLKNGFIWDDPQYVVDNPTLKSADGLWQIWTDPTSTPQYYPMVHTTFWIEAQFPGGTDHATKFHADNVLLHALAAVLLWRCLVSLEIPAAWLAAAIFAVHPVMVESVTWVTERKNVLSIVFYLSAFLAYRQSGLMSVAAAPAANSGLGRNRWYLLSLSCSLLALLSKTVTCSLPAAILLLVWWKRGALFWRDVKPLLPMLVAGLVLSAVTSHLEHTRVGARGPDFDWSLVDRCLIAGHAVCFYGVKLVWPHPLMFMYPKWDLHHNRAMQFAYPAVVIAMVLALWAGRRRLGRGPLVAVLFFIGTLFPALGFVNVYPMRYSFVADHFQYLASIGLITLLAAGLWRISKLCAVILLPLAWVTWQQQAIYADARTLWENTIAQNPTCWMAHVNMASVLAEEKRVDAAMVESQLALWLAPNEWDTNYDVGFAYARQSDWKDAEEMFRSAIRCDPLVARPWSYLARVLWEHVGTPQAQAEGLAAARQALQLQPDLSDAHYVLARAAEYSGDLPDAIAEYEKTLKLNDKDFAAHYSLGNCLLQIGRSGDAAGEYQKVLKHDANNVSAWTNLGYACFSAGRKDDAVACFKHALSIKPDFAPAIEGLKKVQSR